MARLFGPPPPREFEPIQPYHGGTPRVLLVNLQIVSRERVALKASFNIPNVLVQPDLQGSYSTANILKPARAGQEIDHTGSGAGNKGFDRENLIFSTRRKLYSSPSLGSIDGTNSTPIASVKPDQVLKEHWFVNG